MPRKQTYFAPGTHVWVFGRQGKRPGVVQDRQSGVYRIEFEDKSTELHSVAHVGIRRS